MQAAKQKLAYSGVYKAWEHVTFDLVANLCDKSVVRDGGREELEEGQRGLKGGRERGRERKRTEQRGLKGGGREEGF